MHDETPTGIDVPLFDGYEPAEPVPTPEDVRSAGQRLTDRQFADVTRGVHPLTRDPLHQLASRNRDASAPKDDPFTCGSCYFREVFRYHGKAYPKCTFGLTTEMKYLTDSPRITNGAASDVRAWWPACRDYSPGASLSADAARYVPSEVG